MSEVSYKDQARELVETILKGDDVDEFDRLVDNFYYYGSLDDFRKFSKELLGLIKQTKERVIYDLLIEAAEKRLSEQGNG